MKTSLHSFARGVLAALPLLLTPLHFEKSLQIAGLVLIASAITGALFKLVYSRFSERFFILTLFFLFAALAQLVWYFLGLKPFWVVSLAVLLTGSGLFENAWGDFFKKILIQGVAFALILTGLAALQFFVLQNSPCLLFQSPTGYFLLLALLAWMVQWSQTRRGES